MEDRTTRIVHGCCGAFIGALAGLYLWAGTFAEIHAGWLAIPVGAAIFGLAAAFWLETFWEKVVPLLKYW